MSTYRAFIKKKILASLFTLKKILFMLMSIWDKTNSALNHNPEQSVKSLLCLTTAEVSSHQTYNTINK